MILPLSSEVLIFLQFYFKLNLHFKEYKVSNNMIMNFKTIIKKASLNKMYSFEKKVGEGVPLIKTKYFFGS